MSWMIYDHLTMWPLDHIHMTVWPGDWSDEWTKYTARQGDMKWKKILKDSRWCDKNGLYESFKMSPHLICLNWGINFHITSRPDPEAGHKRDLRPQLRHIKWGLILKLSMRLFSWHSPKSLRIFFHFESLSRSVPDCPGAEYENLQKSSGCHDLTGGHTLIFGKSDVGQLEGVGHHHHNAAKDDISHCCHGQKAC